MRHYLFVFLLSLLPLTAQTITEVEVIEIDATATAPSTGLVNVDGAGVAEIISLEMRHIGWEFKTEGKLLKLLTTPTVLKICWNSATVMQPGQELACGAARQNQPCGFTYRFRLEGKIRPPQGAVGFTFRDAKASDVLTSCPGGGGSGGGGGGLPEDDECEFFYEEPQTCGFLAANPICFCEDPIFISVRGNRINLTDRANGVFFDLNADGVAERIPWTQAGSDDVLLVLDRNGNGWIDDGSELFGNFSPQPVFAVARNGFTALSIYDDPSYGGNGDGRVSARDPGFHNLQFWRDVNHDGISQPGELRWVRETRVVAFDLDYRDSRRVDEHGNRFRYVAQIHLDPTRPGPRRKFAVDVFFPPPELP